MKMTITEFVGTPEEILFVRQRLGGDGHTAIGTDDSPAIPGGTLYPSVEVALDFLTRRALSKDQSTFFRMLYKAHPQKVHANELRKAMGHTKPSELTGVLGALGRRFANTQGEGDEFMTWQEDEKGTSYGLPETVREALKRAGLV